MRALFEAAVCASLPLGDRKELEKCVSHNIFGFLNAYKFQLWSPLSTLSFQAGTRTQRLELVSCLALDNLQAKRGSKAPQTYKGVKDIHWYNVLSNRSP